MQSGWTSSWLLGLLLIAVTLAIHAAGVVMIAVALTRCSRHMLHRHASMSYETGIILSIVLVSVVGLLLGVLHGVEAAVWALAYMNIDALPSRLDAMLYSVDSLTTRGSSGLELSAHWRLMGALESAAGMLLFGISTAFLFAVLQQIWPVISALPRRHQPRP